MAQIVFHNIRDIDYPTHEKNTFLKEFLPSNLNASSDKPADESEDPQSLSEGDSVSCGSDSTSTQHTLSLFFQIKSKISDSFRQCCSCCNSNECDRPPANNARQP